MLIHEKMIAIFGDIEAIGKNEKNQMQGFKFRGIDTVYNELHDLFAKHQVFCLPEILEEKSEERTTAKGGNLIYRILKIKYKFVTLDGSFVEAIVTGEAMDSGDKASNKAMAIAHKYVLLQTFMIPTDEEKDPDATTPPESTSKTKTTTPPPAKKETKEISVINQINQSALPAAEKANLIDQYNKKPEHLKKAFYDGCIANRIKQAGKSKTADMVAETFAEKPEENPASALFDDSDVPFDEDEIPPGKDAQPYKGQPFDEYAKGSKKVGKPAGNLFNTPDGNAPANAY